MSKDAINLDSNKHYLLGKTIKLRSLKMQEDITGYLAYKILSID